jgi:predicted MFS family arabinose efflux permease
LALLAAAALAVSVGGMATEPLQNAAGLLAALCLLLLFRRLEQRGPARVLPLGACDPRTKLGATYLAMVLLLLGVTSEIFVPYFLQVLHGLSPLHAGYLSALMSGGWSVASITSATSLRVRRMLQAGPLVMAAGLLILFVLMPQNDDGLAGLVAIGVGLTAIGAGIGLCWPHLGASVFTNAQESERDLAGASITTVIMVGNAFGSALGGMVTNIAGVAVAPSAAAAWLFGLVSIAPLCAMVAMRRVR